MNIVNKQVKLQLVGLDGNAFALMGAFSQRARREGWTKDEIDAVLKECQSSDYNHLLATLADHCKDPIGSGADDYCAQEENEDEDNG